MAVEAPTHPGRLRKIVGRIALAVGLGAAGTGAAVGANEAIQAFRDRPPGQVIVLPTDTTEPSFTPTTIPPTTPGKTPETTPPTETSPPPPVETTGQKERQKKLAEVQKNFQAFFNLSSGEYQRALDDYNFRDTLYGELNSSPKSFISFYSEGAVSFVGINLGKIDVPIRQIGETNGQAAVYFVGVFRSDGKKVIYPFVANVNTNAPELEYFHGLLTSSPRYRYTHRYPSDGSFSLSSASEGSKRVSPKQLYDTLGQYINHFIYVTIQTGNFPNELEKSLSEGTLDVYKSFDDLVSGDIESFDEKLPQFAQEGQVLLKQTVYGWMSEGVSSLKELFKHATIPLFKNFEGSNPVIQTS